MVIAAGPSMPWRTTDRSIGQPCRWPPEVEELGSMDQVGDVLGE
jgi:hypothetical protein